MRRVMHVAAMVTAGLLFGAIVAAEPSADAAPVWKVTPSPYRVASFENVFRDVACAGAKNCFAVGRSSSETGTQSLIEHWNGKTWAIVTTASGSTADGNLLFGVTCVNAKLCFVVGSRSTDAGPATLVLRWNGAVWSTIPSPSPPVTQGVTTLYDVACTSAKQCFAVGTYMAQPGTSPGNKTLVLRWNGAKWLIVASPNVKAGRFDSGSFLNGVSCPTTKSCYAVGEGGAAPLVEKWNGTRWSIVKAPGPPNSQLTGVTCTSATRCIAVGYTPAPLIEQLQGTRWAIVTSPFPRGANYAALTAVSCRNATSCIAVGRNHTGPTDKTFVQQWNGTRWSNPSAPSVPGATTSTLWGVSCLPTICFAVGEYAKGGNGRTLAARFA